MPRYKASAVARHQFLLNHFHASAVEGTPRYEVLFHADLPRASTFHQAVNEALKATGGEVPEGGIEISEREANRIKWMQRLFVGTDPKVVTTADGAGRPSSRVTYIFRCKQHFYVRENVGIHEVLDKLCKDANPPGTIAGVRSDREEVYARMHVALRKCADSPITSALWNAMHIVGADARNWMADLMSATLSMQEFGTDDDVLAVVKEAFLADDEYGGIPERALIHCLLTQFKDSDWMGLLSYCIIWPFEAATDEPAAASEKAASVA